MDRSTVIAIIGTIATLVLGISSVYLALKRRYPGRITLLKEGSIGLFDSIVRNLPELSIAYKDEPVSQNLVLLKAIVLNSGSIDIREDMIEEDLTLNLPEHCKWLTGRVVSTSPKVRATLSIIDQTSLVFDLGLFRCNESIRFEALAEVPVSADRERRNETDAGKELDKVLTVTHRIANTQKVNREELDPDWEHAPAKPPFISFVTPFFYVWIGVTVLFAFADIKYSKHPIRYNFKTPDGQIIRVLAYHNNDDTVDVRGMDRNYYEHLSTSEFYSNRDASLIAATFRNSLIDASKPFLYSLPLSLLPMPLVYYVLMKRRTRLRNLFSS